MKGRFDTTGPVLMAMNDDGTGAHQLLSSAQVPPNDRLGYPSLLPNGTTLAFEGITDEYDAVNGFHFGDDGANYGGIYTFSGGVASRVSDPPAPTVGVGSEDTSPSLTADGRVVYEQIANSYDSNGNIVGSVEQLRARSLSGGAPTGWATSPANSSTQGSADPANGGLLAYFADTSPRQLQIGDQGAAQTIVVAGQPEGFDPAWSPDGSQIADVDWTIQANAGTDGFSAGLWLFPAAAHGAARELVADPSPPMSSLDPGSFGNPVFVGTSEVAFSATVNGATNLFEVPTSCNACSITSAQVKQLTSDGTASSPDDFPAWTSQTLTEFGQGGGAGGTGSGGSGSGSGSGGTGGASNPGAGMGRPTTRDLIKAVRLSSASARYGKRLTLDVTLASPSTITIKILRFVPASGHGRHRHNAHYTLKATLTLTGTAGLNKVVLVKLHGLKLPVGRYQAKVSAGGPAHVVSFTITR